MDARSTWVGIDVGGRRKGFHLAAVRGDGRVQLSHADGPDAVETAVGRTLEALPVRVAVDAPAAWAPDGVPARPDEVAFLAARVCAIRFTPDAATAAARTDGYYEWVEHGLQLWHGLREADLEVVECFPTASWTRWLGPREQRTRPAWTGAGIASLYAVGDGGVLFGDRPRNQDQRDALAAALTARQSAHPDTVRFGPLVVPPPGPAW
ncbi:DUF429 domain-containing protein [Egicoccus sp. AB-alg2]|uniref:DUF429 domain-containing protein n=1 Tax=Egicoccus sp. AB-alg2 TaxID=3242693 RepID=UPI00359CDB27